MTMAVYGGNQKLILYKWFCWQSWHKYMLTYEWFSKWTWSAWTISTGLKKMTANQSLPDCKRSPWSTGVASASMFPRWSLQFVSSLKSDLLLTFPKFLRASSKASKVQSLSTLSMHLRSSTSCSMHLAKWIPISKDGGITSKSNRLSQFTCDYFIGNFPSAVYKGCCTKVRIDTNKCKNLEIPSHRSEFYLRVTSAKWSSNDTFLNRSNPSKSWRRRSIISSAVQKQSYNLSTIWKRCCRQGFFPKFTWLWCAYTCLDHVWA